ncbi:MAG: hypothetical protein KDA44_08870 [Planctomycetales bacterium]|nr:hypothetical protein [Planctomycetales bacterium]
MRSQREQRNRTPATSWLGVVVVCALWLASVATANEACSQPVLFALPPVATQPQPNQPTGPPSPAWGATPGGIGGAPADWQRPLRIAAANTPPPAPTRQGGVSTDAGNYCGPACNLAPGPHPGVAGPGFMRSLGRYSPLAPYAPGEVSMHAPCWDQMPAPAELDGGVMRVNPHRLDCRSSGRPYCSGDFSPDPMLGSFYWDACGELGIYGCKHLNPNQRPWVECFTPLYDTGPWAPSGCCLGATNPTHPKFYVYGDFRTAVANNQNVANGQTIWANRLNLDIDFWLTATERFHMFWGPLDQGQNFSGIVFDDGDSEVQEFFDAWDPNTDTMFIEGDLGWILGGLAGTSPPFDLPVAVGLIPLVLQNGIWLEDAFVGVAATIPARNNPLLDWSNFDTTVFVGFNQLTSKALGVDSREATFVGATTFIERRGGYFELGYAYVDDPENQGRSYHNLGVSYTRRYLNLVSNSVRAIVNTGQGGPRDDRTADGLLLLMENSFLTRNPYNVIPYVNLFVGFGSPQPLGRLQGPLKNTGINFESDLLTGYPLLDDSGNNTYGAAVGVDLLGACFNKQLIVEGAAVQTRGNDPTRIAPGDQYAVGVRYQHPLNNTWLIRMDAMHGWLQNANDINGARVELRKKF